MMTEKLSMRSLLQTPETPQMVYPRGGISVCLHDLGYALALARSFFFVMRVISLPRPAVSIPKERRSPSHAGEDLDAVDGIAGAH